MGGNALICGYKASPIRVHFDWFAAKALTERAVGLVTGNKTVHYSGSARLLNLDFERFSRYRLTIGDVDVQVDQKDKKAIRYKLEELYATKYICRLIGQDESRLFEFRLVGFKEGNGQIITLWQIIEPNQRCFQIDFEFVEFDDASLEPTLFSKFAHSSNFEDVGMGFKGVFHKMIFRALCSLDIVNRTDGKRESRYAFSVTRGLRDKFIEVDGQYYKAPTEDSHYITNLFEICKILFKQDMNTLEIFDAMSFVGCVKLINKYLTPEERLVVLAGFINVLFGPNSQAFFNNSSDDFFGKKKAVDYYITETKTSDLDKVREFLLNLVQNPKAFNVEEYISYL